MESQFGRSFGKVRLHHDARASELSESIRARAFTVGHDVFFKQDEFHPSTRAGQRLLAHELAHVVQQTGSASGVNSVVGRRRGRGKIQRQPFESDVGDLRPIPPPNAVRCAGPSDCPKTFCEPYNDLNLAIKQRNNMAPFLLAGIGAKVGSRVVRLWAQHLFGGSAPQDLSGEFAADFTASRTTAKANRFLMNALEKSIRSSPPNFPPGESHARVTISSRIPAEVAALAAPNSSDGMNFNVINEVPGNIAGGIGTDQTSCKAGAKPSPFNDERAAFGTALIRRDGAGNLAIEPDITYRVKDTIDLCPGNCGTSLEQLATIPISQFEATGISGDIPFTVVFPANAGAVVLPGADKSAEGSGAGGSKP